MTDLHLLEFPLLLFRQETKLSIPSQPIFFDGIAIGIEVFYWVMYDVAFSPSRWASAVIW